MSVSGRTTEKMNKIGKSNFRPAPFAQRQTSGSRRQSGMVPGCRAASESSRTCKCFVGLKYPKGSFTC